MNTFLKKKLFCWIRLISPHTSLFADCGRSDRRRRRISSSMLSVCTAGPARYIKPWIYDYVHIWKLGRFKCFLKTKNATRSPRSSDHSVLLFCFSSRFHWYSCYYTLFFFNHSNRRPINIPYNKSAHIILAITLDRQTQKKNSRATTEANARARQDFGAEKKPSVWAGEVKSRLKWRKETRQQFCVIIIESRSRFSHWNASMHSPIVRCGWIQWKFII